MSGLFIISIIVGYFIVLMGISYLTSRKASNDTFFIGDRSSKWYLVSFGMIGASLSGITFISVPGMVGGEGFSYMQMVIGYLLGYAVIAFVLLPLYYKYNLTSIYTYLNSRYGENTHKIGALFFIISRILGASVRLFLVADVLDFFVLSKYGLSFEFSVLITLVLIYIYTYRGGIKTIVWTDTLQTTFMLLALGVSVYLIIGEIGTETTSSGLESLGMTQWFVTEDFGSSNYWIKGILGGFFITVAMTGLDQDMMQKNLTCRNKKESQKNMIWFSVILFFVNFVFLVLGGLLLLYLNDSPELLSTFNEIEESKRFDRLFPLVALNGDLGFFIGITFILGLIAAAYSSADSALTSLTTSTAIDLFKVDKFDDKQKAIRYRKIIHISMTLILFIVILLANAYKDKSVINTLFELAGFTYGPLLGLFFFGIISKRKVSDNDTWLICFSIPVLLVFFKIFEEDLFIHYKVGHELLGINGVLCFLGLYFMSKRKSKSSELLDS